MDFSIHEILVTLILISPLAITLIFLTLNFIGTGIRDLSNKRKRRGKESGTPKITELDNKVDIKGHIKDRKREGNI